MSSWFASNIVGAIKRTKDVLISISAFSGNTTTTTKMLFDFEVSDAQKIARRYASDMVAVERPQRLMVASSLSEKSFVVRKRPGAPPLYSPNFYTDKLVQQSI